MNQKTPSHLHRPPAERVDILGHRAYVGGNNVETWYEIAKLQYHFLVSEGLRPHHRFLDIACGSLRLGQLLIPFLDEGNYFGLEAEPELVAAGLKSEFYHCIADKKAPRFQYGYDFNFGFVAGYDFAIAQSLFTHLTLDDIGTCFERLAPVSNSSSRFYFTFFEGEDSANPAIGSDPHRVWHYSFEQLRERAETSGWGLRYVGAWSHPRNQVMALGVR
jgi:SAM-dependent methyltransferase